MKLFAGWVVFGVWLVFTLLVFLVAAGIIGLGGWAALRHPSVFIALVVMVYFGLLIFIRWNNVSRPTRSWLKVQIRSVEARIEVLRTVNVKNPSKAETALEQASALLSRARDLLKHVSAWDVLMWSRGREMQAWRLIHQAERLLIEVYDDAQVRARLWNACQELDPSYEHEKLHCEQIKNDLKNPDPTAWREDLDIALGHIYDRRDTAYSALDAFHGQGVFLLAVGGLLIALIGAVERDAAWVPGVLLAGAVGGVLSRLAAARRVTRVIPTDYGASWVTLFLAPLAGALAAWGGVLILGAIGFQVNVGNESTPVSLINAQYVQCPAPGENADEASTGTSMEAVAYVNIGGQEVARARTTIPGQAARVSAAGATATAVLSTKTPTGGVSTADTSTQTTSTAGSSVTGTSTASQSTQDANVEQSSDQHVGCLLGTSFGVLALAFLLGFSERLFNSVAARIIPVREPKAATMGTDGQPPETPSDSAR